MSSFIIVLLVIAGALSAGVAFLAGIIVVVMSVIRYVWRAMVNRSLLS